MVWGLFPADPIPGENKYYVFRKGTYKVGRKGCDVIILKDKGVSRIHAEIVIDVMTSLDHPQKKSSNISPKVRIRDCSKYGTFINKNLGSKQKVHEFPNRETTLKDGDLVSFGTGNATFRFCFVPLIFFVCCSEPFQANQLLQDKISAVGACITCNWSPECTHVLINDFMPLKEDAVDAIVAKKPFVQCNWVEFIAEKNICTEIPSCSSYAPTLMFEGLSVKVADPRSRENCLRGYTFLLESTQKYKFKDRLQSLLDVAGAKVVAVEGFYPSSQGTEDEGNDHVICVIPAGSADGSDCFRNHNSLSRVTEINLICATFSGHLDPSVVVSPPVLVTSSCSTDETVVADSDAEIETATSLHTSAALHTIESSEHEGRGEIGGHTLECIEREGKGKMTIHTIESTECEGNGKATIHILESIEREGKGEIPIHTMESIEHGSRRDISAGQADDRLKSGHITCLRDRNDSVTAGGHKVDESESGNSDIIYSQDLIVRDTNLPASVHPLMNSAVLNFKRFKKMRTQSGNSFNNLIPFSKYPYKNSDCGSEEVVKYEKEEKKRKQVEAVAEDLFNNDKGKRRAAAGSLRGLLSHS